MFFVLLRCRSGETGRHAWFRTMWRQLLGGSNPPFGTILFKPVTYSLTTTYKNGVVPILCPKPAKKDLVILCIRNYPLKLLLRLLPVDYQFSSDAYVLGRILLDENDDRFPWQAVCFSGSIR